MKTMVNKKYGFVPTLTAYGTHGYIFGKQSPYSSKKTPEYMMLVLLAYYHILQGANGFTQETTDTLTQRK